MLPHPPQLAITQLEARLPAPLEKISVLVETDPNPPVHHLLVRGSYTDYGQEVQPGVPAALTVDADSLQVESLPTGRTSTGQRRALARWVTSPRNPLFARVMVNRIWQHHFGEGIVSTPNNFGMSGAPPSHQQLLDYLALDFIRGAWSIKRIHRLILNSAVYQQRSTFRVDGFAADPENHLLWRFPIRRLDAEAIRDSMLAVSGELNRERFGPYVPVSRLVSSSPCRSTVSPAAMSIMAMFLPPVSDSRTFRRGWPSLFRYWPSTTRESRPSALP